MRRAKYPKENNHIVSFRVTSEEKRMIDSWARKNDMTTSSVLRAMFHYLQGSTEDVIGKYKETQQLPLAR